ncbi:sugar diacid recognition domain-containing protein [Pseudomonas sp. Q1-7]|uniref:sugar diacid recognition domain-containing protein n=1 Tax=Pseudomonas sp. Q1-7 TaxID=3020843 RepID=UPI002300973F|nr:sugar diacid recognition domain-containing protein [Pseudomonas sp. Q1-7]
MLELDSALAQLIVDRAMAILPYNINVMDEQGMIIGTGDPLRLHTRHEGAQLVLANRRVVEIDSQAAECLRGVRPGVNLPLFHAERLIGVLGITGEPEVVRPYAELVRMAAEVLVEQRQLQVERHWQRHQLEAWLCQLADPRTDLVQLSAEAERIGLLLGWRQQVCLLELAEEEDLSHRARLIDSLSRQGYLCAPLSARELISCRPFSAERDDQAWLELADERGWGIVRLCVSDPQASIGDLREAAVATRALLAFARACRPTQRLLRLEEHRLSTLLFTQRDNWLMRRWLGPLQRLRAEDTDGVLRQTLLSWRDHDGHTQDCARALGIHRNTLRYRLERIAELGGLEDVRHDQLVLLCLGLDLLEEGTCANARVGPRIGAPR